MSAPTRIRYPSGECPPHGRFLIRKGDIPMMSLISPNNHIVFDLLGGLAVPDPTRPESVQIKAIRGLMAPWHHIEQQGATQDGVSNVDSLYGPTEIDLDVVLFARSPKHLRRLRRHLLEALAAEAQSTLSYITPEMSEWWSLVRWREVPTNAEAPPQQCRQELTLKLQGDNAFYQSYPDLSGFEFAYEDMTDTFKLDRTAQRDMGPNWPQLYDGNGGGYMYSNGQHALWLDDPDDTFVTQTREVINGPYKDFETETDNQIVAMVLGSYPEWSLPDTGANDLWGRMGREVDGSWDGNGIRLRVHRRKIELTSFVDGDAIWTRTLNTLFVPHPGDKWQLACGFPDDPRLFKVYRGDQTTAALLTHKEVGTGSRIGAAYRGVGFGARAASAIFTQASPAIVRKISAGDNAEVTQSGYLTLSNAGDQPAYKEITVYGPGTFGVANGPGSSEMVEIGPLAVGEIAHLRTDPRNQNVFDYTEVIGAEASPALFGAGPSDTMYRKVKGRFTADCAIPPKESGMRVQSHKIKVSITGGNADSMIEAAVIPLRRRPD